MNSNIPNLVMFVSQINDTANFLLFWSMVGVYHTAKLMFCSMVGEALTRLITKSILHMIFKITYKIICDFTSDFKLYKITFILFGQTKSYVHDLFSFHVQYPYYLHV